MRARSLASLFLLLLLLRGDSVQSDAHELDQSEIGAGAGADADADAKLTTNGSSSRSRGGGNGSGYDADPSGQFTAHQRTMVISMIVTMVLALVGNGFLGFAIVRRARQTRAALSPVQVLILHTGLADLLFALLTLFPQLIRIVTFPAFHGNNFLCRLQTYLSVIPMYASSLLLVALSADRYLAICRPLASIRQDKRRRARIFAGSAWSGALLASVPQLFIFRGEFNELYDVYMCVASYPEPWQEQAYVLWFTGAAWLLPSLASAYLYTCVCLEVWKSLSGNKFSRFNVEQQNKEAHKGPGPGPGPGAGPSLSRDYVRQLRRGDSRRTQQANYMDRQRTKTVKLTATIVACNFLLYSPFCITNVIYSFSPTMIGKRISVIYVPLQQHDKIDSGSFVVHRSGREHLHNAGREPEQLREPLDIHVVQFRSNQSDAGLRERGRLPCAGAKVRNGAQNRTERLRHEHAPKRRQEQRKQQRPAARAPARARAQRALRHRN